MYVFILLLYIWCNTDVADTHLIPTRRHTEIGTMVILGIQRLSNYFFPSPLIKQSLFDLKLGKIASLFKNRCWFPLWLFFFFLHLFRYATIRRKMQFYHLWDGEVLIPLLVCSGKGRPVCVL